MDHLPLPLKPYGQIRCKYSPNTYNPPTTETRSFFEFDRLSGFDFLRVTIGYFENGLRPEHLEGFFQDWLYFTFLKAVLGANVDTGDFVRRDSTDGNDYLSTCHLNDYIKQWHGQYKAATDSTMERMESNAVSAFQRATHLLDLLTGAIDRRGSAVRLISHEFEVAVWILFQTLQFGILEHDSPRQRVIDENGTHICPILTKRLLDYRWCRSQVNMLACSLDVPSLYYASLLGPDASGKDHSACGDALCEANQVDQSRYETAHAYNNCQCRFVGPSFAELADIVQEEQIPVIELTCRGGRANIDVKVRKLCDGMRYVALSHIWADGLGNPNGNSLPICQLIRLSQYVRDILQDRCFLWCDTLCVPTKPQQLRRKAIWKMRDIYEKAYMVLVIDASLMCASLSCSAEELMMHVTCSGWVRRLWTFQENFLAQKFHAVLRDGTGKVFKAGNELLLRQPGQLEGPGSPPDCYRHSIAFEATAFYRITVSSEPVSQRKMNIGGVWESLQWRMTSWLSDEPICLATLLGIDLRLVLEMPEDQRMKKIFSLLDGWPPYLIFAEYERMCEAGWKWAPRTLMRPRAIAPSKFYHMNAATQWHEAGLIVEFPGFVMDMENIRNMSKDDAGPKINLTIGFSLKDRSTGAWFSCIRNEQRNGSFTESFELEDLTIQRLTNPAVILSCPAEALSLKENYAVRPWDGLLVDVKRYEQDIFFCNYIVRVLVGQHPPDNIPQVEDDFKRMSAQAKLKKEPEYKVVMFTECDVKECRQKWCVG